MNTSSSESDTSMRLNKALAHAGLCARRKADELIFSGVVRVNNEVVDEPGRRVDVSADCIEVNGSVLDFTGREPCHLVLHKPTHVVSTARDPEGRTTVLDMLPEAYKDRRLYPVGRLDFFSEGLIILTDDGELANLLAHPRHHLSRHYEVRVRGEVPDRALEIMRKGMTLSEGERLARVDVTASPAGEDTLLSMILHQGVNRQIRRMCRDLHLVILRLVRVGLGSLELGSLEPGTVRSLTAEEVQGLRDGVKAPGAAHRAPRTAPSKGAQTRG